jgi:hypothetical protein
MSTWIILSWVFVLVLTVINIIVFVKLKQASEQMMKMAFPGAKNMNEAVSQMQKMMGGMGGMGGIAAGMQGMQQQQRRGGSRPAVAANGQKMDAQLKAAMDMLKQMQQKGGKR